jgi:putative effector of murein hydrolase LrgA (UPF0299 family)
MPSDAGKASAGALLLVLLLAALLRVASALTLGDVERLHGDEGYYVRAARSLVAGDGYPGALRPPGYPAFVAAALALGGGSLRAARMVQIGVALLGVALVGAIVRRRFGAGAAALSALLAALDPTLIFYSHLFWSETLVATLLLGALFCLDRFDLERRDVWLAAAGVILGAAVLTRDMLLFFVPAVVGWTWLVPGGARPSIALRRAALVVVPVLLLVVPWMLRNQALLGRPLLLSTNSWYPLAVGNLIPRDRLLGMGDENRAFVPAYYAVPGEIERAAFAREAALRAIADRRATRTTCSRPRASCSASSRKTGSRAAGAPPAVGSRAPRSPSTCCRWCSAWSRCGSCPAAASSCSSWRCCCSTGRCTSSRTRPTASACRCCRCSLCTWDRCCSATRAARAPRPGVWRAPSRASPCWR